MDYEQLRTFVTVARLGTFSAAAREISLTQSGVSRQIQKLERELGVALFDRSEIPLALTSVGETLLTYAERALAQQQELLDALRPQKLEPAGELRIAASTTPGEFLVPRLVAAFTARYPGVSPEVRILDSAEVVELLKEHAYDVGFVGARDPSSTLVYQAIAEDEVVLAVPARHPFARRETVRLEEFADQPLIAREGGSGTLRSVYQAVADHGLEFPPHRVIMVLSSTEAVVSAVRAGLGLGFVSSLALVGRSRQEVRAVRLEGIPLRRALYLVYQKAPARPSLPQAFIAFTLEHRPAFGTSTPRRRAGTTSTGRRETL